MQCVNALKKLTLRQLYFYYIVSFLDRIACAARVTLIIPMHFLVARSVCPRSRTAFGSRVFSTTGPEAWNQLPADIRILPHTQLFS